jgi:hypothetical protein
MSIMDLTMTQSLLLGSAAMLVVSFLVSGTMGMMVVIFKYLLDFCCLAI